MAEHLDPDRLLAFAMGELDPHDFARVRAHVSGCARCAGELAWAEHDVAALGALNADLGPLPPLDQIVPRKPAEAERRTKLPAWTVAFAVAAVLFGLVLRNGASRSPRSDAEHRTQPAVTVSPAMHELSAPTDGEEAVCAPVRACTRIVDPGLCGADPQR